MWESVYQRAGPLVNKPQFFQRTEALITLFPTHPDVKPARKWVVEGGKGYLIL
jgi:hypothetical protein